MPITRRGKRRILLLLGILAVLGAAGATIVGLRGAHRARQLEEARTIGLAAHERGEHRTAVDRLEYVVTRDRSDLEALRAFAESRALVPETDSQHLHASMAAYQHVLEADPADVEAMRELLGLYRHLDLWTEIEEMATRLLAVAPADVTALAAEVGGAFRRGEHREVVPIIDRLCEMEPDDLGWRTLYIDGLRQDGAPVEEMLAICDRWIQSEERDGRYRLLKVGVLADTGRRTEATTLLREAVELGADAPRVLRAMLLTLEGLDMAAECDALIAREKARHPEADCVFEAAIRRLWQTLRLDEADAEFAAARRVLGESNARLKRWGILL